jgi:ubiquinone/menaquinone biosynthesis C-methylase UbiE
VAVNFDLVAPHYRWLEKIVFGPRLQIARMAFVRQLSPPRRVLVVGEGDGRFLAEFVKLHPETEITCVEASPRMLELARKRTAGHPVHFLRATLEGAELPEGYYDLVVTHFFLDCFPEKTLPEIVARLARATGPQAQWLIAEFQEPVGGWLRLPRRGLIRFMYFFFRLCAGIEGRRLIDYRPLLRANGFELSSSAGSPNDMIRSELWRR